MLRPLESVVIHLTAKMLYSSVFQKFQEYLTSTTRIARLESKQEFLRKSISADTAEGSSTLKPGIKTPRRKRIGRFQMSGQPKLFGGSLEEYLESTNQEIPLIVKSCIRVINLFGTQYNE